MSTVEHLALRNKHRSVPVAGDIDPGDLGPDASHWKREIHAEKAQQLPLHVGRANQSAVTVQEGGEVIEMSHEIGRGQASPGSYVR
jgi:hypothetical protein